VFLVTHVLSFSLLFVAVLWHAEGAWKFLVAGGVLWAADHAIRLARACGNVRLKVSPRHHNHPPPTHQSDTVLMR